MLLLFCTYDRAPSCNVNQNLSEDEIANVNLFTTISHTYFKIPKTSTNIWHVSNMISALF